MKQKLIFSTLIFLLTASILKASEDSLASASVISREESTIKGNVVFEVEV